MRKSLRPVCVCGLAAVLAGPVAAEPWSALVIGTPGPGAPDAFAQSFHVHAALRSAGLPATLLREADGPAILDALAEITSPAALIYYTGPAEGLPVAEALTRLREAGADAVALVVENCDAGDVALPVVLPEPLPEGLALYVAASAEPGQPCPAPEATVSSLIRTGAEAAPQTLQSLLADSWTLAGPGEDVPFAPGTPAVAPVAVSDLIIVDLAPATPVAAIVSVAPVDVIAPASLNTTQVSVLQDDLVVFVDPAPSQIAAQPLSAGLPEPSIIVGLIAGSEATFETVSAEAGDVNSNEIAFDNLDARRALRDQDPELFETLVAAGAFDPPEALLSAAIQTEMARMGCYSAGIDGIWGNGSRNSVTRYFDQIEGESAETLEPTFGLFRQIMRQDDVTCPAVVVVAPAPAAPRPASSNAAAAPPRQQPAAAPRPQPAPAPAPAPQATPTIRPTLGTGVLR